MGPINDLHDGADCILSKLADDAKLGGAADKTSESWCLSEGRGQAEENGLTGTL